MKIKLVNKKNGYFVGFGIGNLTEKEMENIDKKLMVVLDLVKYLGRTSESRRKSF